MRDIVVTQVTRRKEKENEAAGPYTRGCRPRLERLQAWK